MSKKRNTSEFIAFPDDNFNVTTLNRDGKAFRADATGLYFQKKHERLLISYTGPQAGESYVTLELPRDVKFLNQLAKKLKEMAKDAE